MVEFRWALECRTEAGVPPKLQRTKIRTDMHYDVH